MRHISTLLAGLTLLTAAAAGDTIFVRPPAAAGGLVTSAYMNPDGYDGDQFAWDVFSLSAAASITEIRWRGGYPGNAAIGSVVDFEVAIFASIPAGTQPDLGYLYPGPLVHYMVSDSAAGNAGEAFAGTAGGTNMYDYHFTLPHAFAAAANTRYWVQIIAWQNGFPSWGLSRATGGDGSHFARVPAGVGDFRFVFLSGDPSFTLNGTWTNCSAPTITTNPQPVVSCPFPASAVFTVAASGAGPYSYRWLLNGNPVYDGPNGGGHGGGANISGATTNTLTIASPSSWADVGTYSCQVSNACGNVVSAGALLGAGASPSITLAPQSQTLCIGDAVTFTSGAQGAPTLVYRWERGGVPLSNGTTAGGAVIQGATTSTLTVTGLSVAEAGSYVCRVSNGCGTAPSPAAVLTVNNCTPCPADFNQDGGVDGADVEAFFLAWEAGDMLADVNADGGVDGGDIETFFTAWEAGGC